MERIDGDGPMNSENQRNTAKFTRSRNLVIAFLAIAASAIAGGAWLIGSPGPARKPVTTINFQLPWYHSGAFAGYYAADQNGDFADNGLSVQFLEGGGPIDNIRTVVEGKAQLGIASANHLIKARAEGIPVRAVAVMHQINPVVFVSLEGSGITHPKHFAGKTIRSSKTNLPILHALAQRFGVTPDQYQVVHMDPRDFSPFYSGEIDILAGFHFYTKNRLDRDGKQGNFMYPDNYGVHFYRDCIFTTDDFIVEHPEVIARFLRAALTRGWIAAIQHPEAVVPMTAKYLPDADLAHELAFLTAMLPLINTGEVPIGWMDPKIWTSMANTLVEIGILEKPMDVTQVYTLRFLREIYETGR
jgi:NitT/TauT family transport system substrate-binding protein